MNFNIQRSSRFRHWPRLLTGLLALLLLVAPMSARPVFAQSVITVNTFADELNANGNCSLREAIQAANTNAAVDACPAGGNSAADVINLPAGTYTLAIAGVNETANAKGDLNILGDVIINGASAATTIINANSIDRVFTVASNKTVHMNALTIMGGTVVYGGGIQNLGNLTITNSTIKDNVAATAGGIDSSGTLMLIGSTISGNRITAGGYGGLWNHGSATLVNSTVSGNTSSNVGGIYNDQNSSLTLINVTVSGNGKTNDNKSGIGNAGTLILSNTIINNNCANTGAGTASATSHHNLMLNSSNACGLVNGVNNNQVGANPQLGTLANNQGNTFTHALLVGSPAIDAGDVATCAAAPVNNRDQRNFARPVDGNDDTSAVCDIGSFEFRATASQPEIDVQGNNVSITSGDTTPSTIDDTDFGRAEDDGNFATSHLFTINNLGNEQLDISDIMLSGAGKDEFRLTFVGSNPPTSVPPNNTPQDSFVFFVDFGPRTPGLHQATVSIANNDDNENPYTFAIQGTGGAADGDNDGIPDGTDNCPAVSNPDQANFDGDGQGDACDADDDNDGLSDVNEAAAGTNPHNPDTDNDTVGDNSDICPLRGPVVAVVSNNTPLCPAPANTVTAAGAASPIAVNLHGQSSFGVPVRFAANGPKISSVDFKLTYDKSCLAFDDTTDGNNDGLPDALVGLPNTHVTSFQHNAGTGDLTLIIAPPNSNPPLPLLTDGTLVTVRFNVLPACVTNDGTTKLLTFGLSNQHYGNDQGQSVNGSTLVEDYELRFNANPTDITLDNGRVNENANNAVVGTLDSLDIDEAAPRPGDSHTYTLRNSGCGAATDYTADNGAFQISGATLKTRGSLDFEAQPSYTICLRSTDQYGGTYEEEFTVAVNDLNEAPTSLDLSNASVNENEPTGAVVGSLTTQDDDLVDDANPPAGSIVEQHTYSLPAGQLDNAQFAISGNQLVTNAIFDHEVKNSYNVRIRTTDSANQSFERVYTISITNVNDAPVANDDPTNPPLIVVGDGNPVTIEVLANDTDQDGDGLTVSAINSAGTLGSVTNNTTDVSYTAPPNTNGADSFGYTVADNGLGALTDSATVNLYVVANDARADCNSDGNINAADFPALVLEIFDTDVPNNHTWWRIFEQGFTGSPLGCDANASRNGLNNDRPSVNAADIICTVLVFFGNDACTQPGVLAASAADAATFSAPQNLAATASEQVAVDLTLDTGGNTVSAVTFALVLDTSKVTFDATDADADGVPDTITFNVPASMTKSVTWNAELSRLEVALFGAALPLPTVSDGVLATVNLDVADDASGDTPLTLDLVSLGDDQGADVEVTDVDGSLHIAGSGGIYLPIIKR